MFEFGVSKSVSRKAAVLLFFIGLFAMTQINIGGKLGISEFAMVACAPFVFIRNLRIYKNDHTLYFFVLILLWLAGAVFVDFYTHNHLLFMLRGIAVPITMFSGSVCVYTLLRKDFSNLKWLLLGLAISNVLCIFVFQRGAAGDAAAEYGLEAGFERVVGYKLFWVNQLTNWLTLPISGWYLQIPKIYSLISLVFLSIFNLTTGGRSAFLIAITSLLFVLFGGKSARSLQFFKKHVVTFVILLCLLGIGAKSAYRFAATHGYMGAAEAKKYEESSSHGGSALDLLMAGRGEAFIGLIAALDKPIIGHGSVAIDNHGYVLDYMLKYGDMETYERIARQRVELGVSAIPAHSYIVHYWMWHGIFGLLFWLSAIVLVVKTLLSRIHLYPPWFGYLAVSIPAFMWNVLFSPLSNRVGESMFFAVLLLISTLKRTQNSAV